MTEFKPGTSPPPVRMPMRFMRATAMLPDRRGVCGKPRFLAQLASANGVPPCVLDPHSPAPIRDVAPPGSPLQQGPSRRRAWLHRLWPRPSARHRSAEGADPRVGDVPGLRRPGLTLAHMAQPPAADDLGGRSVSLPIPRDALVLIIGVAASGKSTFA